MSARPETIADQLAYLTKGCVDVVRESELRAKLERAAETRKPLVVKVGFDPTAPDLHLGHTVLIRKMKLNLLTLRRLNSYWLPARN